MARSKLLAGGETRGSNLKPVWICDLKDNDFKMCYLKM